MLAVLTFLQSPLGRKVAACAAIALVILALLAEARHSGAESVRKADVKATAARHAQVAATNATTAALAQTAGSDAKTSQAQIVYRTRTLIQKAHDEKASLGDAVLNAQWVSSLNAAWGVPSSPAPAAGTAPSAGSVRAADALETLTGNAGICLQYRDLWERTVAFYDQQAKAVNGR